MEKPLITYILFGFNQAHFVKDAIECALLQKYSPLEIILTDDCSTDETFSIMREMAANYRGPHKIILNRNEQNRGVGAHVNKAFSLASGKWIVTAASDDLSDLDRCERVTALAYQFPDAGAIGLGWRDIDERGCDIKGRMLRRYKNKMNLTAGNPSWIRAFECGDFGVWGMSAAWRTEMVRSVPPLPDTLRSEDEIYSFWASLSGYSVIFDNEPKVSYRRHMANVSGYINTTDQDLLDKRRIIRSRINLQNFLYIAECIQNLPKACRGRWSNEDLHNLAEIVNRKISFESAFATWWECGTIERLRRSLVQPERRRRFSQPKELIRILPRSVYLKLVNYITLSSSNRSNNKIYLC